MPPLPPAGWYSDPEGSGQMRWWDGAQWAPVGAQTLSDTTSHAPVTTGTDPVADTAHQLPVTAATYDAPPPRRVRMGPVAGAIALAVVIVVGVGLAAVALGHHGSNPSATPGNDQQAGGQSSAAAGQARSSSTSPDKPAASQNTGHGFGPVKLGMNEPELRATHAVSGAPWGHLAGGPSGGGTCWHLPLKGTAGGSVLFDPHDGLVDAIRFSRRMATSKGIRIGSPWSALVRAYPDLNTSGSRAGGPTVTIAHDVRYYFGAAPKQGVSRIALGLDSQGCIH